MSPLAGDSCACKEGHGQPPNPLCTRREAAVETRRRATGKTPAASPESRRNEPWEGFNHPSEDFALAPALYGGFGGFDLRQSTMEMEEIFLQLCEEVTRLQDLCLKQGKLLQKLIARKGPILDIPVSLPIQCTEDMLTEEGERPPDSHQKCSEAPASAASDPEGSAHPLAQLHAAGTVPGFDGKYPPSAANSNVFSGGTGGAALAVAFGSNKAERSEKVDVDTWLKTCRMLPTVKTSKEEVRACCSPQELVVPSPVVGSFLTLLDLYEVPEALRREDAPSESALPAEAKVPVEIRGPVKTSWMPGWMLEDGTLGQGAVLASEDAQACDICQEIFPLDAAGQADYLKHVLAHMK